jgi:hypothetical protein
VPVRFLFARGATRWDLPARKNDLGGSLSRIRRAAVLTAVIGAATVALAAPASADPVVDSWQYCSDVRHGAQLCLTAGPDPADPTTGRVIGTLTMEPGRTFDAASVNFNRCGRVEGPDGWCERVPSVVRSATNGPFSELVTEPMPLDDDYQYNLSSFWIDDQSRSSGPVRVSSPELAPEW